MLLIKNALSSILRNCWITSVSLPLRPEKTNWFLKASWKLKKNGDRPFIGYTLCMVLVACFNFSRFLWIRWKSWQNECRPPSAPPLACPPGFSSRLCTFESFLGSTICLVAVIPRMALSDSANKLVLCSPGISYSVAFPWREISWLGSVVWLAGVLGAARSCCSYWAL